MFKKCSFIFIGLSIFIFAFINKNESLNVFRRATHFVAKEVSGKISIDVSSKMNTSDVQLEKIAQLKKEINAIKAELKTIDISGEVNNPKTDISRRDYIFSVVDRYAQKIAEHNSLELKRIQEEYQK